MPAKDICPQLLPRICISNVGPASACLSVSLYASQCLIVYNCYCSCLFLLMLLLKLMWLLGYPLCRIAWMPLSLVCAVSHVLANISELFVINSIELFILFRELTILDCCYSFHYYFSISIYISVLFLVSFVFFFLLYTFLSKFLVW